MEDSTTSVLVPVRDSVTLRQTIADAVSRVADAPEGTRPRIYFVYPLTQRRTTATNIEEVEELLDRVAIWAGEDLESGDMSVDVETAIVGEDQYLFNPRDYANVLYGYATEHDVETVVLDPEFNPAGMTPLIPPLEAELERLGLEAEVAPVERPARRLPIVRRAGLGQFFVLFAWAYGFYLLVGGTLSTFNLATGALSGLITAVVLWQISLRGSVNFVRLAGRLGRMAVYVPFLLWEIAKANVHVAYVVLHPSLPIDPRMVEFDAAVWEELPVTTLANSITLTPGTLTVDVTRRHFTVHTLNRGSREGLFDGGLERAVRFVFYGRSAARIASPRERGVASEDTDPMEEQIEP